MSQPQLKQVSKTNNPYDGYELKATTQKKAQEPNTPQEKYKAYVHKAMEEASKKYGVRVENQALRTFDRNGKMTVSLFSGYIFIENEYHERHKAIYRFSMPTLYFKGMGEDTTKRVCNPKTGTIQETHSQVGDITNLEQTS